ncbi:MAG: hypothetical protein E5X65_35865 [Mesorhizobium sp.]|nr:MAG: hypothetical protein E5X65_35865 [Mesorhizobium sp.]
MLMNSKDTEAHEAFCRYAEAKGKVEQTMDFTDAKLAGQAWVTFLNLFLEPEQQMPTGNIIPFPRRQAR